MKDLLLLAFLTEDLALAWIVRRGFIEHAVPISSLHMPPTIATAERALLVVDSEEVLSELLRNPSNFDYRAHMAESLSHISN